jgi:hypothetical protein
MRDRLIRLLQLGLAAFISAAAGGLILVPLLFLAAIVTGSGGGSETDLAGVPILLAAAFFGGGMAIWLAVGAGWVPAFVAGAALWWAGRHRSWARRRLAWAIAGAAAALVCYLRVFPPGGPGPSAGQVPLPEPAIAAAFMLAGAAAGQVYRSALAATAPFFGFDEDPEAG